MSDSRRYPDRPFLAVSAAIVRAACILLVRRALAPAAGLYSLPGGIVEAGETLAQAIKREVREETALAIELVDLVAHREVIVRDPGGRVERHFVILAFAARWQSGEAVLSKEIADARWAEPSELAGLPTTEGLADVVSAALRRLA